MGKERETLDFGDELQEFDPKDWTPPAATVSNDRPNPAATKKAAVDAGFQSRPIEQGTSAPKQQRRRRTGRDTQCNIKTTAAAKAEFEALADALNWGLGETFEKAIPLLRREYLDDVQK